MSHMHIMEYVLYKHFCFIGRSWQEKVGDVRKQMKDNNASVLVVTALDEVACELEYLI